MQKEYNKRIWKKEEKTLEFLGLQRKMKKVVSTINQHLDNIFKIRKTYEKELKTMDTELKAYNKQMRQINKDLKIVEKDSEEATKLKEQKEEVFYFQEMLKKKKQKKTETFTQAKQEEMETITEYIENAPQDENEDIQVLKDALLTSHIEENNHLLELQNKIDGLEKLNRAEMPASFRVRVQAQLKELYTNKEKMQASYAQKRENLQLKIEEARKQLEETGQMPEAIREIVQAIQEDEWKQAEKIWEPYKQEFDKTEEEAEPVKENEEFENVTHAIKEETITLVGNVEETVADVVETPVENVVEVAQKSVQTIEEEKVEENTSTIQPEKIHSIFVDIVTQTIYADKGQNEGKDYNVEMKMLPAMLQKDTMLETIRKHVPNFDRIVKEKETGEASKKSEEDYNRYMEIFGKVDPLVITVLDSSHEDFRQYLKAVKNQNKEEMPCELYYNVSKITKADFTELEQDEIIETVEKHVGLAVQIKGLKSAKRARNWRRFENQHTALRTIMRWIRMEEKVQQLTDGK